MNSPRVDEGDVINLNSTQSFFKPPTQQPSTNSTEPSRVGLYDEEDVPLEEDSEEEFEARRNTSPSPSSNDSKQQLLQTHNAKSLGGDMSNEFKNKIASNQSGSAYFALFCIVAAGLLSLFWASPYAHQLLPLYHRDTISMNPYSTPLYYNMPIFTTTQHDLIFHASPSLTPTPSIYTLTTNPLSTISYYAYTVRSFFSNSDPVRISSLFLLPRHFITIYSPTFHNLYRYIQWLINGGIVNLFLDAPEQFVSTKPPTQTYLNPQTIDTLSDAIFPPSTSIIRTTTVISPRYRTSSLDKHISDKEYFSTDFLSQLEAIVLENKPQHKYNHFAYDYLEELNQGSNADIDEYLSHVLIDKQYTHNIPTHSSEPSSSSSFSTRANHNIHKHRQQKTIHTIKLDSSSIYALYQDMLHFLNEIGVYPSYSISFDELYIEFLQQLSAFEYNINLPLSDTLQTFATKPINRHVQVVLIFSNLNNDVFNVLKQIYKNDSLYKLSLTHTNYTSSTPDISTLLPTQQTPLQYGLITEQALATKMIDVLQGVPNLLPNDFHPNIILLPDSYQFYHQLAFESYNCTRSTYIDEHMMKNNNSGGNSTSTINDTIHEQMQHTMNTFSPFIQFCYDSHAINELSENNQEKAPHFPKKHHPFLYQQNQSPTQQTTFLSLLHHGVESNTLYLIEKLPDTIITQPMRQRVLIQFGVEPKRTPVSPTTVSNSKSIENNPDGASNTPPTSKKMSKIQHFLALTKKKLATRAILGFSHLRQFFSTIVHSLDKRVSYDNDETQTEIEEAQETYYLVTKVSKLALFAENNRDLDLLLQLLHSKFYRYNIDALSSDLFAVLELLETQYNEQINSNTPPLTSRELVFHTALTHLSMIVYTTTFYHEIYDTRGIFTNKSFQKLEQHHFAYQGFRDLELFHTILSTKSQDIGIPTHHIQHIIDLINETTDLHHYTPFLGNLGLGDKSTDAINKIHGLTDVQSVKQHIFTNPHSQTLFAKQHSASNYLSLLPKYIEYYIQDKFQFRYVTSRCSRSVLESHISTQLSWFFNFFSNLLPSFSSHNQINCIIHEFPFIFQSFSVSNNRVASPYYESALQSIWFSISSLFTNIPGNNNMITMYPLFNEYFKAEKHNVDQVMIRNQDVRSPTIYSALNSQTTNQTPVHPTLYLHNVISTALLSSSYMPFSSSHTFKVFNGLTTEFNQLTLEPLSIEAGYATSNDLLRGEINTSQDAIGSKLYNTPYLHESKRNQTSVNSFVHFLQAPMMSMLKQSTPFTLQQNSLFSMLYHHQEQEKKQLHIHIQDGPNSLNDTNNQSKVEATIRKIQLDALYITHSFSLLPALQSRYEQPISNPFRNLYSEISPMTSFLNNPSFSTSKSLLYSNTLYSLSKQRQNSEYIQKLLSHAENAENDPKPTQITPVVKIATPSQAIVLADQSLSKHGVYFMKDSYSSALISAQAYAAAWLSFIPFSTHNFLIKSTFNNINPMSLFSIINQDSIKHNFDQHLIDFITTARFDQIYSHFATSSDSTGKFTFIQHLLGTYRVIPSEQNDQNDSSITPSFFTVLTSGFEHLKSIHSLMVRNTLLIGRLEYTTKQLERSNEEQSIAYKQIYYNIKQLQYMNDQLQAYTNTLSTTLIQIQNDLIVIFSKPHQYFFSQFSSNPTGSPGGPGGKGIFNPDTIPSNINLQSQLSLDFPVFSLPTLFHHLYSLSAFYSLRGSLSYDPIYFDLSQKLAIKCLYRSRLASHQFQLPRLLLEGIDLTNSSPDYIYTNPFIQFAQTNDILTNILGSNLPAIDQQQRPMVLRLPSLSSSALSFYYQHHIGSPTDTFRVVHNFITGTNSDTSFLCHLYIDMVSNMLHNGIDDKMDYLRYIDQTNECLKRHHSIVSSNTKFGNHFNNYFSPLVRLFFHHNYPGFYLSNAVVAIFSRFSTPNSPFTKQYLAMGSKYLSNTFISYDSIEFNDLLRIHPTLGTNSQAIVRWFESMIKFEGYMTFTQPFSAQGQLYAHQAAQYPALRQSGTNKIILKSPEYASDLLELISTTHRGFTDQFNACHLDTIRFAIQLAAMRLPTFATASQSSQPITFHDEVGLIRGLECLFGHNHSIVMYWKEQLHTLIAVTTSTTRVGSKGPSGRPSTQLGASKTNPPRKP